MKVYHSLKTIFQKPIFIFWVYLIVSAVAAIHRLSFDLLSPYPVGSLDFINNSTINNFTIYCNSFYHLIHHTTLYSDKIFATEQFDEFLYSPSFTILIIPFALLPKYVGVVLWAIFNGMSVFYAIKLLPTDGKKKIFIYWFILLELLTSIQNEQVNPLICALFVFTFVAFERKKVGLAALLIVISMFIKVFGIVGAALFLLYPDKLKFIAYFIFWSLIVFIAPVIFISFTELIQLYKDWFNILLGDHKENTGDISVMRMLSRISRIEFSELTRFTIQVTAVLLFCIKYIRYKSFDNAQFRYYFIASVMIWSVIFNHAVESCSYVIAMTGVAIWYAHSYKNKWNLVLLIFAFIFTTMSPTDMIPKFIRDTYMVPFALKALPCFLIWIKIEYEMIFSKKFTLIKQ